VSESGEATPEQEVHASGAEVLWPSTW
jgi:hypothetical protein